MRRWAREREGASSAEHVDTLKHWLGRSLYDQGKYKEAEGPLREEAQGFEKTLGAEHADTLDSKHWLGRSLHDQGKYKEAEGPLREAAQGREKILGAEHVMTLGSKHWLGRSLHDQGRYKEAEGPLREAAQGFEKTVGAEHADTLNSKYWLGLSLYKQGKHKEAEGPLREEAQGFEKTLGAEHTDTLSSKLWLGISLYKQGKHKEAEGPLREASQGREKTLGAEHADTITSKTLLQKIQEAQPTISPSPSGHGVAQASAGRLGRFFDEKRDLAPYTDSEVYEVSALLKEAHSAWSRVPRIYIILRTIGQLDLLNEFIQLGFSDHWLPLTEQALPRCLRPNARAEFTKTQDLVLTKSAGLERGEKGQHCHFKRGEPLPFERKAVLGTEGFGQVDKVISLLSFKEYALKRVRRDSVAGGRRSEAIRQFIAEIEILKSLKQHRHTVQFMGSYTNPKWVGLLMAPVAEKDLAAYLRDIDTSKRNELRTFFGCLARALEFLHDANIRHKDIKPGNILVHRGSVLFTDFGLSLDFTDASGSTTVGMVSAMSPQYCTPEVAMYEPRSRASDIWSLGVVFLEMATVLKGETVEYVREFLQAHGSKQSFVRTNRPATAGLIEELEAKGESCDNQVMTWVREMLQAEQELRPTAISLITSITAADGQRQGRRYCGIYYVSRDESSSETDDESEDDI